MDRHEGRNRAVPRRRLFAPEISTGTDEVILTGAQKRYVRDVLRMGPGDMLVLFDGTGFEFPATILEVSQRHVRLRVLEKRPGLRDSFLAVGLAIGVLKTNKMDLVIQKAAELGVHDIYPLLTQRAVPDLDLDRAHKRHTRWRRIAEEASRQCGRATVACVHPIAPFEEVLATACTSDLSLLFTTCPAPSLAEVLPDGVEAPERILVLVGPEGGLSEQEEQSAEESGFVRTTLGPRVLRAETAALLAVGLVQYRFGDLGRKVSRDPLAFSDNEPKRTR